MEKKLFFALLFAAATGICAGAFLEVIMEASGKEPIMDLLSVFFDSHGTLSVWASVRTLLLQNTGCLLLGYLSPLLVFLLLPALAFFFFQSLFLGFSSAMLYETFGFSGIRYLLVTLAPAGILRLVLFALLWTLSILQYRFIRKHRTAKNRNALSSLTGQYLHFYLAGFVLLIITCFLQAFLLQAVTGP